MVKPCPFCGSMELFTGSSTPDREGIPIHISCDKCGACGPWAYFKDKSILGEFEEVCDLTGWNDRAK